MDSLQEQIPENSHYSAVSLWRMDNGIEWGWVVKMNLLTLTLTNKQTK